MARNQERNFGNDRRDDRFPEDYEQRRFSGHQGREMMRDDHHRGSFGADRDYIRDYGLGTGTSMRMNRYESSQSGAQDRGFYGKGPKGWKRSDDRIKDEVCEALYDSYSVDASDIEVSVKDGHVSLAGSVDSRESKREVERLIDGIRGVEDVLNNLKLKRQDNITALS